MFFLAQKVRGADVPFIHVRLGCAYVVTAR